MHIRQVEVVRLEGVLEHPEPFWDDTPDSDYPLRIGPGQYFVSGVFIEVTTDAGVVGLGGPVGDDEGVFVARQLAPVLIGRHLRDRADITRLLDRRCQPHDRVARKALSAVDIALWDLAGKAEGLPVYRLLDKAARTTIPAYASADGFSQRPERVREQGRAFVAAGYRAIKWFFPYETPDPRTTVTAIREDLALVQVLRESVGDDIALMLDVAGRWNVPHTETMLAELAPFHLRWLEDPIPPDADAYARLQAGSSIPLATGGDCGAPADVQHLLDADAAAILQPDVSRVGGISALLESYARAASRPVQIVPHGGSVAATAHVLAAQPAEHSPLLAKLARSAIEFLPKWQALDQHFFAEPLMPEAGFIRLRETPGLGMALDPARVHRRVTLATITAR
jgi:L-rhamnonate dehydratase